MKRMITFGMPIGPVAQSMIEEAVGEQVQITCVASPVMLPAATMTQYVDAWVYSAMNAVYFQRIDLVWLPELGAASALILPELARQQGRDEPDLPNVVVLQRGQFALELAEIIPGAMFRTW
jgi:hypothetical protein